MAGRFNTGKGRRRELGDIVSIRSKVINTTSSNVVYESVL